MNDLAIELATPAKRRSAIHRFDIRFGCIELLHVAQSWDPCRQWRFLEATPFQLNIRPGYPGRSVTTPPMADTSHDYTSYFGDGQEGECRTLKPSMVRTAEESLGHRLPKAYINLLRVCNGGPLKRCAFLMPTSDDSKQRVEYFNHVMGIGKRGGINGRYGSKYLIDEWDYPDTGVVISSDGHTAFMLDYSECGADGEPRVVLVDVELDDDEPSVDVVAPDFASFLQMLVVPERKDN